MRAPRKLMSRNQQGSGMSTGGGHAKSPMVAEFIAELLHGATRTHFTHLKTTSFAAHMALGDFYDALPGMADGIAESWQGLVEELLDYPTVSVQPINTPEEAVQYMRDLYGKVTALQEGCEYSEIVNDLDMIKSLIDKTKYKLLFLH